MKTAIEPVPVPMPVFAPPDGQAGRPAGGLPSAPLLEPVDPVFELRYRAMKAKDARFDGQFITGVHSTGIYCRPSCPARTPHPQNVSFYLTAAAAHEAGLRACKRCFPDAVPGSPEWNTRDDLSARAMRLIDDGVVDREGVDGLAHHLGYTVRHVNRVLTAELGAGPRALARAHRAQGARALLQSTGLPVTDVAFASGFSSIRAFNETILAVYEATPSRLRELAARRGGRLGLGPAGGAGGSEGGVGVSGESATTSDPGLAVGDSRRGDDAGRGGRVTLNLPARAPFDGAGVVDFLAARAVAGVEEIVDGRYRRGLRLPQGSALIEVRALESGVVCTARLENLADLSTLAARVRRLFDLDADAVAIDETLASVAELRAAVERVPGIRVPGATDAHEIVFRALIGQQVSVAAARTALGTLATALGSPLTLDDPQRGGTPGAGIVRLFPTARQIAEGGRGVLRGPAKRIDTIIRVAEALVTGELVVDVGVSQTELTAALTAISGIGPWTAGYVAMRVLGAPDVLLDGDVAVRAGADRLTIPSGSRELAAVAQRVAPWRSYFCMHLWRAATLSA